MHISPSFYIQLPENSRHAAVLVSFSKTLKSIGVKTENKPNNKKTQVTTNKTKKQKNPSVTNFVLFTFLPQQPHKPLTAKNFL